ncbi:MAG: peroxiredoxin-like family protein [Phycisphaeraceae bacterium]
MITLMFTLAGTALAAALSGCGEQPGEAAAVEARSRQSEPVQAAPDPPAAEVEDEVEAEDAGGGDREAPTVPDRAQDVDPIGVGRTAPTAMLRDAADEPVDLTELYAEGPTLLVFYRGGWCPYCSQQLRSLAEAEDELDAMGVRIVALSPDRPARLAETPADLDMGYVLLSDSPMTLTRAFGLAFRMTDADVARYAEQGLDLREHSGESHQLLPVPAVYLVDRDGTIRFAHWNPDYTSRLSREEIVEAARRVIEPRP